MLKNTAVLALALFAAAHAQQDCGGCVNQFVSDGGCDALHTMDGEKLEAISGSLPPFCHDNCDPALALEACGVDPSMFYDGPSGGDGGVDCYDCASAFDMAGGCAAMHNGDEAAVHAAIPSEECAMNCGEFAAEFCGMGAFSDDGNTDDYNMYDGPSDDYSMYDGPSDDYNMYDGPSDGGVDCYDCAVNFDMMGGCAAMHNGDEAAIHAAIPSEECAMMCGEFAAEFCGMGAPSTYDGPSDDYSMYDGPSDDYMPSGPAGCPSPYWVGDNLCDAENNTPECGFDGGDCCIDEVVTTYCGDNCVCNDPSSPNFGNWAAPSEDPKEEPSSNDACEAPWWFGDNYCDDENNTPECGFDGGDCCGPNVNTMYCSDCLCLE